jgi:hypothetical protein
VISDEPAAALSTVDQFGRGLAVEFWHEGSQIAHRVLAVGLDGERVPLLESVQDDQSLVWPRSPVLQGLNVDDLHRSDPSLEAEQSPAMLIGTAGDGHWSLTIEPYSDQSKVGLEFDVACRVRSLPPRLTSCYRISETVKTSETDSGLQLDCRIGEFLLQILPVESQSNHHLCHMGIENDSVQIIRDTSLNETLPATLRWRYGVFSAPT